MMGVRSNGSALWVHYKLISLRHAYQLHKAIVELPMNHCNIIHLKSTMVWKFQNCSAKIIYKKTVFWNIKSLQT